MKIEKKPEDVKSRRKTALCCVQGYAKGNRWIQPSAPMADPGAIRKTISSASVLVNMPANSSLFSSQTWSKFCPRRSIVCLIRRAASSFLMTKIPFLEMCIHVCFSALISIVPGLTGKISGIMAGPKTENKKGCIFAPCRWNQFLKEGGKKYICDSAY